MCILISQDDLILTSQTILTSLHLIPTYIFTTTAHKSKYHQWVHIYSKCHFKHINVNDDYITKRVKKYIKGPITSKENIYFLFKFISVFSQDI
ncbi:hypothetical protein XELAEV_18031129mg [Xenopus laevis]|uniref:Uncharacterized protein n=1 Tax=Xenopus laevis TaxID=8355 RepID=A0A974CMU0_XENLA|nr:hypothetical protein XELAEV_18031129mg [Xenopus laevis]